MLQEKRVILEEKKVKIAAHAKDTKMLTLNLDAEKRMIVQDVLYKMLQRPKDELEVAHTDEMEAVENEA